jgi:hypothetical protein
MFLRLLIVLQIYRRHRPPALLKSSIEFVIQLKEKLNAPPKARDNLPMKLAN